MDYSILQEENKAGPINTISQSMPIMQSCFTNRTKNFTALPNMQAPLQKRGQVCYFQFFRKKTDHIFVLSVHRSFKLNLFKSKLNQLRPLLFGSMDDGTCPRRHHVTASCCFTSLPNSPKMSTSLTSSHQTKAIREHTQLAHRHHDR